MCFSLIGPCGCITLAVLFPSLFTGIDTNLTVILSLMTFLAITITCPILSPDSAHIDSHAVWTQMTNGSNGWPDGIAYLTGLSTPQFMLSGLDAALHLAEECLEAEKIVPRAVMVTVLVGFLTAFPFAIAAVYSWKDIAATLDDPTGYCHSLFCHG